MKFTTAATAMLSVAWATTTVPAETASVPSGQPSSAPSAIPSSQPSEAPSMKPSESLAPSDNGSASPSGSPSDAPSTGPSKSSAPSGGTSSKPSSAPSSSNMPSGQLSSAPSAIPSSQPSEAPSMKPSESLAPSDNGSASPSGSPSDAPSTGPSKSSAPSGGTSTKPSSAPSFSTMPSGQESSSPSAIPSSQPSEVPSMKPSESSSPSDKGSASPSGLPSSSSTPSSDPSFDPSITPSAEPSPTPKFEVLIVSAMNIATGATEQQVVDILEDTSARDELLGGIEAGLVNKVCPSDSSNCEVTITSVNGINVAGGGSSAGGSGGGRKLLFRRSLNGNSLVIEFEVLIESICNGNTVDCSDPVALGDEIYAEATGALQASLTDGSFLNDLQSNPTASTAVDNILDSIPTTGAFTATFEDVIVPFLERYPSSEPSASAMPSGQPSLSSVPSSNPSSQPSGMPSGKPSLSSAPSSSPSFQPSAMPSGQPSLSSAPSDQPSGSPSESPSDTPSSEPSSVPSPVPSSEPSSAPSSMPSSVPSSAPSCTPSASPTEKPSTEYGVNLFYPDWLVGDQGCRNDGDEPNYMAVNPTFWLSSSLEACCKKWFSGYNYNACIGKYPTDSDDCVRLLYYPDWHGSNKECIADGKEPLYMLNNHNMFLFNSKEECCKNFYDWDYYACAGTTPVLTNGEFYPDWSGSTDHSCIADGKAPDYMLHNQNHYLAPTLEKCCKKHFSWDVKKCLGDSPGSTYAGTNEWYVNWTDKKCVQDCNSGAAPCGGIANSWDELYTSQADCCKEKLFWVKKRDCVTF